MTEHTSLLVEKAREGYAVVTLNRPQALNALSADLRGALCATFTALGQMSIRGS